MNPLDNQGPPFYGKYRGVVTDNRDPNGLGRVRARVADVLRQRESGWALPSTPFAGPGVGLFLVPPIDAWVWIEFEHGNPDYPIWSGCFWLEKNDVPKDADQPETKLLKTDIATIKIDDRQGSGAITIETTDGMKIEINTSGIEINNGQGGTVKLQGPTVSINDDALEVT
jgi:uncharacterized protein involved in type VI secretion and phage assembly